MGQKNGSSGKGEMESRVKVQAPLAQVVKKSLSVNAPEGTSMTALECDRTQRNLLLLPTHSGFGERTIYRVSRRNLPSVTL